MDLKKFFSKFLYNQYTGEKKSQTDYSTSMIINLLIYLNLKFNQKNKPYIRSNKFVLIEMVMEHLKSNYVANYG